MNNKKFLYKKSQLLPNLPGVYLMKDTSGGIIYIGKAKNLKNRVSSYFSGKLSQGTKVQKMVENVSYFEYVITDSEFEALVLECSLIKKHQPKYNILLKDDKGYSFIRITNNTWPRISYVKQKVDDDSIYLGPYTGAFSIRKLVEEALKVFKLPNCSRNLENVYKRPCLNFYINRCCAPCTREISCEKYRNLIKETVNFLKSGKKVTLKKLTEEMNKASENMNFELAAELRDKVRALEKIKEEQKVVSYGSKELDAVAIARNDESISVEVFKLRNGDLCKTQNFILSFQGDLIQARTEFIKQNYCLKNDVPKKIILDGNIEDKSIIEKLLSEKFGRKVKIKVPKSGEDFRLLEMCKSNAYENLLRKSEVKDKYELCLQDLKNALSLKVLPRYIEAYDISNLFKSDCVGAMIVVKDGRPFKSSYRKFKIHEAGHQDDYESMREMVERRFLQYKKEGNTSKLPPLPDIILIDGGKAHVGAAKAVLDKLEFSIPIFGMVKDSKHRTRALTTEKEEIKIKSSRLFAFITSVQDEVHRFAVSYHRKLRNKRMCSSALTQIPGIGPSREKILLKTFGSLNQIAQASVEKLRAVKGMNLSLAKRVYEYFHSSEV